MIQNLKGSLEKLDLSNAGELKLPFDLKIGSGSSAVVKHIEILATIPSDSKSLISFTAKFDGIGFSDLAALSGLIPNVNFKTLPTGLKLADSIKLSQLDLIVSPADKSIISVSLEVLSDKPWTIIEDLFEIELLKIRFTVTNPLKSVVRALFTTISGKIKLKNVLLFAEISMPDQTVVAGLANDSTISLSDFLGTVFPSAQLPNLQITGLKIGIQVPSSAFSLSFDVIDDWELEITKGNKLSMKSLSMDFEKPGKVGGMKARINGSLSVFGIDFALRADNTGQDQGLEFIGKTGSNQKIPIGHLIGELATTFGLADKSFPKALESLIFENLAVSFNTVTKHFYFSGEAKLEIDEHKVDVVISIDLEKDNTGAYQKQFSGELTLGTAPNTRIFDLIFSDAANNTNQETENPAPETSGNTSPTSGRRKLLLALYRKPGGEQIPIKSLLTAIVGTDHADDIPDMTFKIMDALLVLEKTTTTVAGKTTKVTKYLFTSDIDLGLDLSGLRSLPLIGQALPQDLALRMAFQPIISSSSPNELSVDELAEITALIPAGGPVLPTELKGGVGLITTIQIGDLNKQISLGIAPATVDPKLDKAQSLDQTSTAKSTSTKQTIGNTGASTTTTGTPTSVDASVKWIQLGKNFGPLQLARIGVAYKKKEKQISALLDGGLSVGPFSVSLEGLGANYDMTTKALSFSLNGLGLELIRDPLEISGAFMRMEEQFVGRVSVKADVFGFTALGAYGNYQGHPSFFIYAFIDIPLGGPVFFMLEGLAFGFGYNRRLIVPPINEIYRFPFVSEAMGETQAPAGLTGNNSNFAAALQQEFVSLAKYIPEEVGQYFLAVGLKFSSFKTLDSFALLIVNFGKHFDLAVIGTTSLTVPSDEGGDGFKVAEVEMTFSVRYMPEEGFLSVEASLTPNSFILSKDCKMQGGFAFYSWFKGEHSGDFVVTLGGYHPDYHPPKNYPQPADVPRLGINWRLNDLIYIKGGVYFALTPNAMMMGGGLEAHFAGEFAIFAVNASFTAKADFLMYWQPFHYQADVSVEISCALIIHILFNLNISISAGASVDLHGPDFAGKANVHAKVMGIGIKFDVTFGDEADQKVPRIPWVTTDKNKPSFKGSFLPKNPEETGLGLSVQRGLVNSQKVDGKDYWVINPKEFAMVFSSIIPINRNPEWKTSTSQKKPASGLPKPLQLGIDPVGVNPKHYTSQPVFTLFFEGKIQESAQAEFQLLPIEKNFPSALWTEKLSTSSKPKLDGKQVIKATGGYLLAPAKPAKPKATHAFPVSNLEFAQQAGPAFPAGDAVTLAVSPPQDLVTDSVMQQSRLDQQTLLRQLGFDPAKDVRLKPDYATAFIFPPIVVRINAKENTHG